MLDMKYEVIKEVLLVIPVFWDMWPRALLYSQKSLGEDCHLLLQGSS
jgi:hypothetical protein